MMLTKRLSQGVFALTGKSACECFGVETADSQTGRVAVVWLQNVKLRGGNDRGVFDGSNRTIAERGEKREHLSR